MGLSVEEINKITEDIVSFDMRPEDTECYMKYIAPLPVGSRVVDFGTGQAKNVIRMALCAPQVEIWTWDWGRGWEKTQPQEYFRIITDRLREKGVDNIYFIISSSDTAWPTWDWPIQVLNIDASHSYDQTLLDLKRWETLVVKDGYIFIHDYNDLPRHQQLKYAIDEYLVVDKFKFLEEIGLTSVWRKR